MTIQGFDKATFIEVLRENLSPAKPIKSLEHLYGREDQLDQIEQAMAMDGRQVFIFGHRGVGKSSLAHTAAQKFHYPDSQPILLACQEASTFLGIIGSLVNVLSGNFSSDKVTTTTKFGLNIKGLSGEKTVQTQSGQPSEPKNLNDAIALLKFLAPTYSKRPVVVVDEFDLISDRKQRAQFADFVKQLGDQEVPIQFIFCGIGTTLAEFDIAHPSSYRYLQGVEVKQLSYDARWEIIDKSAQALGLEVNEDSRFRIAAISDGFPHYVHLLCEKLFWEAINSSDVVTDLTPDHYINAIRVAVKGIEHHLRKDYEQATNHRAHNYHDVLWAMADHFELCRNTKTIYQSYLRICEVQEKQAVPQNEFVSRLGQLKTPGFAQILQSKRAGLYEYRENIVRGYVRLRAEDAGVPLALEHEQSAAPVLLTARAKSGPIRALPRPSIGRNPLHLLVDRENKKNK